MVALTETGTTSAVKNQSFAFLLGSAYKIWRTLAQRVNCQFSLEIPRQMIVLYCSISSI